MMGEQKVDYDLIRRYMVLNLNLPRIINPPPGATTLVQSVEARTFDCEHDWEVGAYEPIAQCRKNCGAALHKEEIEKILNDVELMMRQLWLMPY